MYRVLLVDDETRVLTDLESNVPWKCVGITHIFKAGSVSEALEVYNQYKPELIISDIEMSQQTGIDLLKFIREKGGTVPFIFLTCHAEFGYMQNAIRYGSCDYILKPVDHQELLAAIQRAEKNGDAYKEGILAYDENNLVKKSKEYIADHLIENIKISDLAEYIHCSEPYIMKIFKKDTQYSILEYVTMERVKKACELLCNTDWDMGIISGMCGYSDSSYFSRVFKKTMGINPTIYRKARKEK